MAIQPIDLQTMYSQMSNVAGKVANEQQGAQMNSALQQQAAVLQNAESLKTVKKAAGEESKTSQLKEDGHQSSEQSKSEKKSGKQNQEDSSCEPKNVIREDYLGKHIDITR